MVVGAVVDTGEDMAVVDTEEDMAVGMVDMVMADPEDMVDMAMDDATVVATAAHIICAPNCINETCVIFYKKVILSCFTNFVFKSL